MNKNLAIIGASYLQLPLIKRAKELGYTTHVFAWAANDVGEKEADFFSRRRNFIQLAEFDFNKNIKEPPCQYVSAFSPYKS